MACSLIDQIWPGSFRYTYDASKRLAWPDYSFFSIVTLTTIGYGDVVAVGRVKALVIDGRNCHELVNFFDNSLLNRGLLFLPRRVHIDGSQ